MATQTFTCPVPTVGEDPEFDEFVAPSLDEHSDFIDEERDLVWEAFTSWAADAEYCNPADDMRAWWEEAVPEFA
jgi:hypothetical protein